MYESRVIRQIEAAHHNGPPGHKCEVNHGHSWKITAVFEYSDEDVTKSSYGWGPEFGAIKKIIDQYDHQDLNDRFGPGIPPSAENLARVLYDQFIMLLMVQVKYVMVEEGSGNSVRYSKG